MKKLLLVLLGIISLNTYANNCGGQFDPVSGSCRIIGPDGRQIIYNSDAPQSGNGNQISPPPKVIRYKTVYMPPKYGALAYDKVSGAVGGSMNANSLSEAKKAAIRQCGEKGCKVITWVKNGCIAAAIGKPSKKSSSKFVLYPAAEEQGQAESVALNRCEKAGASECRILTTEGCSIP